MLSTENLERLIAVKRHQIEKEKMLLGLSPHTNDLIENEKTNTITSNTGKQVNFQANRVLCEPKNESTEDKKERDSKRTLYDLEENIPAGLERYIRNGTLPIAYFNKIGRIESASSRVPNQFQFANGSDEVSSVFDIKCDSTTAKDFPKRYIGLPVMLKAGEFSPNNPLIRGERTSGDALLGLGEYERRRNTLRKIRQQQYREYLDQQAKKKQEAKEQAEKERREREEKEREREEREREILLERDKYSPEGRRISLNYVPTVASVPYNNKVDTGVQVDGVTRPLSVAVQTDDTELFRLPPSPSKCELTEAERELSPRTVEPRPAPRAVRPRPGGRAEAGRRRSYGDHDERTSSLSKKTNRDKLVSDLRHTYMPSIFDADAIQLRNLQAEKEAATRRQFYQQELKNQILEQQRIKEERKSREKMLEQAEMRRLEEQLHMLRVAQEREINKHYDITASIKDHAKDYETKRTELQKDINIEQQKLLRATSQPSRTVKRNTATSKSDTQHSKLPFYYANIPDKQTNEQPFSFNIPDNSIFSSNYDVDSYLRRNLNFKNISCKYEKDIDSNNIEKPKNVVEKTSKRDRPHDKPKNKTEANEPSPKIETKIVQHTDNLSIPVLRHSAKPRAESNENVSNLSEAMKIVDDKWKVPAIQKNILKTLPNEDGRNINILTQLGSIRRQLQLEQMKLDKMLSKDDNV